jgi:uncharacterized membrane protein YbhN (UPF0104 family)
MTGLPAPRSRDEARAEPRRTAIIDQTVPLSPRRRMPTWLLALKIALVIGGLFVLLHWALHRLPSNAVALDPWSLFGAIFLNQLALFAAAWRLQATLAAFGVRIGRRQAMRIHLQSLFYFFFVPMSIGLEIARFIKVRDIASTVSAKRLLFALLLDRVLGLVAAVAVVAALLPLVMPQVLPQLLHPVWLALITLASLALGSALWLHDPSRRRLIDAVAAMGKVGRLLPLLIGLSLAALVLVCASVYLIAVGARLAIEPMAVTFALSASLLGMLLPVSVLGATVGEAAGAGLFALFGLNAASALLLVSAAYGGRLLGALQGGLIELWMDRHSLRPERQPAALRQAVRANSAAAVPSRAEHDVD